MQFFHHLIIFSEHFFSRSVTTYFNCIENAMEQCGLGEDTMAKAKEQVAKYKCKKIFRKLNQFCFVLIQSYVEFCKNIILLRAI